MSTTKKVPTRMVRPPWRKVLEDHEWFDGEPEITAAAKQAWQRGRYDRPAVPKK